MIDEIVHDKKQGKKIASPKRGALITVAASSPESMTPAPAPVIGEQSPTTICGGSYAAIMPVYKFKIPKTY